MPAKPGMASAGKAAVPLLPKPGMAIAGKAAVPLLPKPGMASAGKAAGAIAAMPRMAIAAEKEPRVREVSAAGRDAGFRGDRRGAGGRDRPSARPA